MFIGKCKIEESNYDCLVFCVRDIQEIKIPNFIKHICSYSFEYCEQLRIVEFSNNSKLQTIDRGAFSESKIKSIQIPSSVTSIGEKVFYHCNNLCIIEIDNAEMIFLYQTAFEDCQNALIMIPVHS